MKGFKRVMAATLSVAMIAAVTGCSKIEFSTIKAKDFAKALEKVDIEELDWDDYWWEDQTYFTASGDDVPSKYRSDYDGDIVAVVDGQGDDGTEYLFLQYEDEDDAHDYFEQIYDLFSDAKEDKEISGSIRMSLTDDTGYVLVNGEIEIDGDDVDVYVAVYFVDDIYVSCVSYDADDDVIEEVNTVLDEIGYSHLK